MRVAAPGPDAGPVANAAARPWLTVAASFGAQFVGLGSLNAFGVFFLSVQREFAASRAAVGWAPGIAMASFLLLGSLTGPLADRYGPRLVVVAGALLLGGSFAGTASASAIWQVYLTQGLGLGLAVAFLVPAAIAAAGRAVPARQRPLAMGISIAGSGAGTLVYAPVARRLIDAFGLRPALVALGVGGAALTLLIAVGMGRRHGDEHEGAGLREAVRERAFRVMWAAAFVMSFTFMIPATHLVPYARDHGVAATTAALLLSAIGGASIVGRFALAAAGPRLGNARMAALAIFGMGAANVVWLASSSAGPLFVFAIAFGMFQGATVTLVYSAAGDYFGTAKLAGIIGALNTSAFVGELVGPPAAGALYDSLGSYAVPIVASAVCNVLAAAILLRLPSATPTPALKPEYG